MDKESPLRAFIFEGAGCPFLVLGLKGSMFLGGGQKDPPKRTQLEGPTSRGIDAIRAFIGTEKKRQDVTTVQRIAWLPT